MSRTESERLSTWAPTYIFQGFFHCKTHSKASLQKITDPTVNPEANVVTMSDI